MRFEHRALMRERQVPKGTKFFGAVKIGERLMRIYRMTAVQLHDWLPAPAQTPTLNRQGFGELGHEPAVEGAVRITQSFPAHNPHFRYDPAPDSARPGKAVKRFTA